MMRRVLRSLVATPRIGMFLSVGIAGALIETTTLIAIVETLSLQPVAAGFVSKELSIVTMFAINDRWTFSSYDEGHWLRRLVKSNLTRTGGLAVGLSVLYVLHSIFGVWYPAANAIGIGLGFVVNYVAESLITWQVHT